MKNSLSSQSPWLKRAILMPGSNRSQNQLLLKIRDEIRQKGPMSIHDFMKMCLVDPGSGYYSTRKNIFNKGGDFTTSPEISQLFGEMMGVWTQILIQKMDETFNTKDIPIHIIELGPGTGELSLDILKALRSFRKPFKNIHLGYVEVGEALKVIQQQKLIQHFESKGVHMVYKEIREEGQKPVDTFISEDYANSPITMRWADTLQQLMLSDAERLKKLKTPEPCLVIAHEFFDAFPIHQFQYSKAKGWCEREIDLAPDSLNGENDIPRLALTVSNGPNTNVKKILQPEKRIPLDLQPTIKEGARIELSPGIWKLTEEISKVIETRRGACLIIDYGDARAFSNSFRGVKNHKFVSEKEILKRPGEVDLSANVNFAEIDFLLKHNKNLTTFGLVTQGDFLKAMGIETRVEMLCKLHPKRVGDLLRSQCNHLCHPDNMGKSYKFLYAGHKVYGQIYPFIDGSTAKEEYI